MRFSTRELTKKWTKHYGIAVDRFFSGHESISGRACERCGAIVFGPSSAAGDSVFYSELSRFDWYYSRDKEEHHAALALLKRGSRLCEVGCGGGAFLELCRPIVESAVGLELNRDAVLCARNAGHEVLEDDIVDYAKRNESSFDYVVSFQVMEHVPEWEPVLRAMHRLLKPDGVAIIAVPNNDALCVSRSNILNLPPHHMIQWTASSLTSACKYVGFSSSLVIYERLQDAHVAPLWAGLCVRSRRLLLPIINRFTIPFLTRMLVRFNLQSLFIGHTIMVVARR